MVTQVGLSGPAPDAPRTKAVKPSWGVVAEQPWMLAVTSSESGRYQQLICPPARRGQLEELDVVHGICEREGGRCARRGEHSEAQRVVGLGVVVLPKRREWERGSPW